MENQVLIVLTSMFIFCVGVVVLLTRKNTVVILLGIELMLNSANLALVSFSHSFGLLEGQMQALFVICIAAAESAVGLSILINLYRNFGSIRTQVASQLKG